MLNSIKHILESDKVEETLVILFNQLTIVNNHNFENFSGGDFVITFTKFYNTVSISFYKEQQVLVFESNTPNILKSNSFISFSNLKAKNIIQITCFKLLIENDKIKIEIISRNKSLNILNKTYSNDVLLQFNFFDLIGIKNCENILQKTYSSYEYFPSYKQENNCFIATVAYEDINHPKVKMYRAFRDKYLTGNRYGEVFIKLYYKYSPNISLFIKNNLLLKHITKRVLDLLILILPK